MKVNIENTPVEFNVQYGNGKKLSIHMDSSGFITVKAPKDATKEMIISAMESKGKWILEKIQENKKARELPKSKEYDAQGKFLYLGNERLLHELIDCSELNEEILKRNLKKFYMTECKTIIEKRIKIYQKQLKVKPKVIEIVESRVKWGSCSSDRKLTFNYRLAMAPIEVIDYVIIHELCHITHMNHDRSFWRRVGSIMPDYKEKEEYLAKHGYSMTL
ncbi:M48 family metallopeptidase [Psychrobacillus antarcticus]|uniref:M48 family metallopeptidase n=1 Tax=Psychrobacillus antarcticus TaxID=2879115 RepID=UPI002407A838|nr:SprT family zinc-dependent metalloprotease [Psychrobacillus antarcticus]